MTAEHLTFVFGSSRYPLSSRRLHSQFLSVWMLPSCQTATHTGTTSKVMVHLMCSERASAFAETSSTPSGGIHRSGVALLLEIMAQPHPSAMQTACMRSAGCSICRGKEHSLLEAFMFYQKQMGQNVLVVNSYCAGHNDSAAANGSWDDGPSRKRARLKDSSAGRAASRKYGGPHGGTLIVAPTAVLNQWDQELAAKASPAAGAGFHALNTDVPPACLGLLLSNQICS